MTMRTMTLREHPEHVWQEIADIWQSTGWSKVLFDIATLQLSPFDWEMFKCFLRRTISASAGLEFLLQNSDIPSSRDRLLDIHQ